MLYCLCFRNTKKIKRQKKEATKSLTETGFCSLLTGILTLPISELGQSELSLRTL